MTAAASRFKRIFKPAHQILSGRFFNFKAAHVNAVRAGKVDVIHPFRIKHIFGTVPRHKSPFTRFIDKAIAASVIQVFYVGKNRNIFFFKRFAYKIAVYARADGRTQCVRNPCTRKGCRNIVSAAAELNGLTRNVYSLRFLREFFYVNDDIGNRRADNQNIFHLIFPAASSACNLFAYTFTAFSGSQPD